MEDVGTLKPKKVCEQGWEDPKLNKPIPNNPIKQNTNSCTYIGLCGSGLFNFGFCMYINLPTLFAYVLGFDIPTSIFIVSVSIVFFLNGG